MSRMPPCSGATGGGLSTAVGVKGRRQAGGGGGRGRNGRRESEKMRSRRPSLMPKADAREPGLAPWGSEHWRQIRPQPAPCASRRLAKRAEGRRAAPAGRTGQRRPTQPPVGRGRDGGEGRDGGATPGKGGTGATPGQGRDGATERGRDDTDLGGGPLRGGGPVQFGGRTVLRLI